MYKMEYLAIFDETFKKADLLWLWFDYHTEVYDRSLWSKRPSPHDETMVLLHSPEARKLSSQYAEGQRKTILSVAKQYNIPNDVFQNAKNSSYRGKSKMQKRIDDYLKLDERGEFEFIKGVTR